MENFLSAMRLNFLYVDQYSFSRTWVYPTSRIPYCMLRYIVAGSAEFTLDDEVFTVQGDDIVYMPEGCLLSCRALEDNFTFISIRFKTSVNLPDGNVLSDYFGVQRVTPCREEAVRGYFYEVLRGALSKKRSKVFHISGNLELIVAYLTDRREGGQPESREVPPAVNVAAYSVEELRRRAVKTNIKQDPRIQVVVDYIVSNPTESLDTEKLCTLANMSKTSLRRCFKDHTGKTLSQFIKELRMMSAARQLLVTDERISAIAYSLGFEDPNYFARSFKEIFGVSPQQYRKSARE